MQFKIRFTLFDFKWLSNYRQFTINLQTNQQKVGLEEAEIEIDLPALEESDVRGDSKYVAGGRIYFETEVIEVSTSDALVGKGFFDKKGYVEPKAKSSTNVGLILGITLPITAAIVGIGLFYYCKQQKKKKLKSLHDD